MRAIQKDSLEIFKTNIYIPQDIGLVSNNAYLSVVATNKCNRNCPYCINGDTDHSLSIPIRKMIERAQSHINRPIEMINADQIAAKRMSPLAGRDGANVPVSTDAGYAGGSGGASASAGGGE